MKNMYLDMVLKNGYEAVNRRITHYTQMTKKYLIGLLFVSMIRNSSAKFGVNTLRTQNNFVEILEPPFHMSNRNFKSNHRCRYNCSNSSNSSNCNSSSNSFSSFNVKCNNNSNSFSQKKNNFSKSCLNTLTLVQ